jgi:hypothetical protein
MNYKDEVCKRLNITVTDMPDGDVSIYTTETQDCYTLYVYTEDQRRVNISEDVFYYDDGLFAHIQEWLPQVSAGTTVYCSDEEELLPDWLWEEIYDELTKDE